MKPLKVAIVSRFPDRPDRPAGGIESATVALVQALCGCESLDVHVVTLEPGRPADDVEVAAGFTVHRLRAPKLPQVADVWLGPGRRRLVRCLLQLRPDVVHSHEVYGLGLPPLPMPHVITVHGFDHLNLVADASRLAWLRAPIWERLLRRGLARAQHVVSISPYVRGMLQSLTSAEIHDIGNPIDECFFGARCREPFGQRDRVLCAGWLSERKNTLGAVEAFGEAIRSGAPGRLVLAGFSAQPSYRRRVEARIDDLGLRDRIDVPGSLDRGALLAELARTRALLLISRQENAPMIVAEAMAAGVPVIASDRCGIPFMVREGETGFLVDPDDRRGIAERLARLLSDDALAARLGAAAADDAAQRFHPRRAARDTLELYRRLVPPAPSAA